MSKIFVTGATGLIGIKLVQRLKEEGHEVAGFTTSENGQQKLAAVNVKAYIGDILNADTIDQALADFKPEIIINQITDLKNVDMAANTKVRIEGSKNLIDAAKKHDVKKVIAQSIAFMYEPGEGLAYEKTALDFNSTGDRKVTVDGVVGLEEETARMDEYVVLRLYGPGTWYGKDGMIYNQFMDGQVTLSDGVTSFVHLDDAVETSIQAIHFENGIYNVADDAPVKGSEFAEWYKEQLGVEPNIDIQPAQPFERGVSNEKFKAQGGTLIYKTWKDGMNPIK
ncbi:TPA: NAD(P)-dependent oxidoreductase [Staphylococcus aureus]|uniref:NAD-dependent epimerase/dehydratase family protein n=1 Tax=Staphylococcus aureus TaxID=1280 RepID=UPI0005EAF02B|nr:NAD(P)-dependent oxidoreductase [Staphylococcus aureus]MBU9752456.1 NAD-dependent epimerase/dehydratase family protein [Staphylococcus aureus]MBU9757412.1 NAD-dependent epimerase/dehydratase family protein [Staphylococcus aureus]MBU9778562.1 NAD-dependent epimerase/dehydratase family protein [Staphylococcus aureus]MBU9785629.1 NAD-dependent epimerase/dehydratase family protein [Staphylococcus aureus]MBU9790604.1 NAD-dependent epimerase/dehydratase family protein [Staphylococcus aureus]